MQARIIEIHQVFENNNKFWYFSNRVIYNFHPIKWMLSINSWTKSYFAAPIWNKTILFTKIIHGEKWKTSVKFWHLKKLVHTKYCIPAHDKEVPVSLKQENYITKPPVNYCGKLATIRCICNAGMKGNFLLLTSHVHTVASYLSKRKNNTL